MTHAPSCERKLAGTGGFILLEPLQLADRIFRVARTALKREANGTRFRLLGVGLSNLTSGAEADPASLVDPDNDKRAAAERAMDKIRDKFGGEAVGTGRSFKNGQAKR